MATITDTSAFTTVQTVDTQTLASAADVTSKIVQPLANRTRNLNDGSICLSLASWTTETLTNNPDSFTYDPAYNHWAISDTGAGHMWEAYQLEDSSEGLAGLTGQPITPAGADGSMATNGSGTIVIGHGVGVASANRIFYRSGGNKITSGGSAAALPVSSTNAVRVFWTGTTFLAVDVTSLAVYASTSGSSGWTTVTSIPSTYAIGASCWASNGAGTLAGSSGVIGGTENEKLVFTTNGGSSWTTVSLSGTSPQIRGVCYHLATQKWYISGQLNSVSNIWSSSDLTSWTSLAPVAPGWDLDDLAFCRIASFRDTLVVTAVKGSTSYVLGSQNGGVQWFVISKISSDLQGEGMLVASDERLALLKGTKFMFSARVGF